jgi:membrane associated rhomboid family serine protease
LVSGVGLRSDLRRSRRGREELRGFAMLVGLQFVFDRFVPGVSGTAHVCGLLGGIIAGAIVLPRLPTVKR